MAFHPNILENDMNIEQMRAKHREQIPGKYQGTYDKAMSGKSRAKAVIAKCQDCCGWDASEVRRCPVPDCPLYPYLKRDVFPPEGYTGKNTS